MSIASVALSERAALCDLMLAVGPDAPTLNEGWSVLDLAAHLVVREHDPWAAPGILLGGAFSTLTNKAMERRKRRGLDGLVEVIRTGEPAWYRPVPAAAQLNEYYLHHEDVRRANGLGPRTDRPDLDAALLRLLRVAAPRYLRRHLHGVELICGGDVVHRHGSPPRAVLDGAPGEILLYLSGRKQASRALLGGDPEAGTALVAADLRI